jgi:hypothetical protein
MTTDPSTLGFDLGALPVVCILREWRQQGGLAGREPGS